MAAHDFGKADQDLARDILSKAGLSPAQIESGALEAALDIAFSSGMDVADAATTAARVVMLLSQDQAKSTPDPDQDLAHEREREHSMAATFWSIPPSVPRIQVLALPPERVADAEENPFILVFDHVQPDSELHDHLRIGIEGLETGTGARAVLIFTEPVDVVSGFEVDPALADRIRAALDRGER